MEPVSILAIVNASLGIARSLTHTIKELYELAEAYETAALGIRTVATQCNSFRIAMDRINKWLVKQDEASRHDLDDDFWQALADNIETGRLVIDDLDKRIAGLRKSPAKFWTRTKYLWNGVVIAELQTQIQGLMAALSILIQVIDIPTTGAKRTQSRALSQRLNGLTVSNRNRARAIRRQVQEQEEALLSAAPSGPPPEASYQEPPPAYAPLSQTAPTSVLDDEKPTSPKKQAPILANEKPKEPNERAPIVIAPDSDPTALQRIKSDDNEWTLKKKSKRPSWKNYMKWSSKQEPSRTRSDPDKAPTDQTSPQRSSAALLDAKGSPTLIQESPAAIEHTVSHDSYFELQGAMSGIDLQHDTKFSPPAELPTITDTNGATSPSVNEEPRSSSPEQQRSNNPYRDIRLASVAQSDFNSPRVPDYRPTNATTRTSSTDRFDRVRPSARVQSQSQSQSETRPRSVSPNPSAPIRRTSADRLSSFPSPTSTDTSQTWQTTLSSSSRPTKFRVTLDSQNFTSKISPQAARLLGLDASIIEYAGVPTTTMTLMYTVSDGSSDKPNTVLGDEIEFVVMDEHEIAANRGAVMVLGAGWAHFAQVAAEGGFLYWNPGGVPSMLRAVDRLRMYGRFELVKW